MAKKKQPSITRSSDAERRARQCDRLTRVVKVLQCISMTHERWDAERLARELEVSERTIHRTLQVLSTAGVPYYFDSESHSYRVRSGFRFPGLDLKKRPTPATVDSPLLLPAAERLVNDSEQFLDSLRHFCDTLRAADEKSSNSP